MAKATTVRMVPITNIRPNPYRDTKRYHIDEEKVEALIASYEASGFWDGSIQGRPTKDGYVEIAFGHHRIEAARRAKLFAVGIVVADRSNAVMLKMMADENRAEFKHDTLVNVETIRAVIDAYGRGEIELETVGGQGSGYQYLLPGGKKYSLATVARFLGWVKPSNGQATKACQIAFDAYQSEATTKTALDKLDHSERSDVAVQTVTTAARAARMVAERAHLTPTQVQRAERQAAQTAVDRIKENSAFKVRGDARAIGHAAVREVAPRAKAQPPVEIYIDKVISRWRQADLAAAMLEECQRLLPYLDDLQPEQAQRLADCIETTAKRALTNVREVAEALRGSRDRRRLRTVLMDAVEGRDART